MSRWKPYNPNPKNVRVGDCPIRAITKALDSDWETVFAGVTVCACALSDMPSANHVWGSYLRQNGFKRYIVDDHGQDVYTVDDFCQDNPAGTYILAITGHVVCIQDGYYWDTWDSGQEIPIYYWERRQFMETLNSIMVVCGWLITLGGAGAVIYKLLHPAFKLKNRVDKLEINVEKDYKSIQEIRDMQSLLCQGMIALIDNRITGNNIEGLKKTKEAMIKHLSEGI